MNDQIMEYEERVIELQAKDETLTDDAAKLEAARQVFKQDFVNLTVVRVHIMSLKYGRQKWRYTDA